MFWLYRLIVFIRTEQTDIEVVTRKLEVIGITTIKRNLLFWGKDKTDIGVTLVAIKMVGPTLPKSNHVGTQTCFVEGLLLDFSNDLTPGSESCISIRIHRERGIDS